MYHIQLPVWFVDNPPPPPQKKKTHYHTVNPGASNLIRFQHLGLQYSSLRLWNKIMIPVYWVKIVCSPDPHTHTHTQMHGHQGSIRVYLPREKHRGLTLMVGKAMITICTKNLTCESIGREVLKIQVSQVKGRRKVIMSSFVQCFSALWRQKMMLHTSQLCLKARVRLCECVRGSQPVYSSADRT